MFDSFAGPLARAAIDDRTREAKSMHPAATAHAVRLHMEGKVPAPTPNFRRPRLARMRKIVAAALSALARRIEPEPDSMTVPGRRVAAH